MTRAPGADAPDIVLSRAEVETLCVLYVVGAHGCPALELAPRLGLSQSLAEDVAEGMNALVLMGLLDRTEDARFLVTAAGRSRLEGTLAELRLASPWQ